jgi:hypothetical protein
MHKRIAVFIGDLPHAARIVLYRKLMNHAGRSTSSLREADLMKYHWILILKNAAVLFESNNQLSLENKEYALVLRGYRTIYFSDYADNAIEARAKLPY